MYFNIPHFRSTFSEFSSKFSRDDRFKAVERAKERETLFAEFISEMKKLKKDNEKAAKSKEEKVQTLLEYDCPWAMAVRADGSEG